MNRIFKCSIGCRHAIEIERWNDGNEWDDTVNGPIEVNVWSLNHLLPFRERIKTAWRALRGKDVVADGICLMHDEAQEMGRYLLAISSAARPSDMEQATTTNASSTFVVTNGSG
ncbi:MAG: hypothetical protein M3R38_06020, partial [Actinomycetota bacterium]|nr:hypothetical protein [Actinomycetota bacterium]